ncbi:unnamed protein product [Caenorhabditis auriculariae]|uniref:Uncharacterized protein n=1 Tax=Caenorhabditis auriculariae TaxID=2777116 RepID=A0A8S1HAS0_9PELO|nr:unnamed protein product [Caenorhabditis auriculariae]
MFIGPDGCADQNGITAVTSIVYRSISHLQQIAAILTVILTVPAIYLLHYKCPFQSATRLLLVIAVFFANTLAGVTFVMETGAVFRSYMFSEKPCEITIKTTDCFYHSLFAIFSCSGLIVIPYALSVDRVISTLFPKFYDRFGMGVCAILCFITIFYSAFTTYYLADPNAPSEIYLRCTDVASYRMAPLATFINYNAMVLISCVFITIFVIMINRRRENRIRFDIKIRYRQREALLTSQVVCWITLVLVFGFSLYIGSRVVFRTLKLDSSTLWVYLLGRALYTFPYAAAATPGTILYAFQYVKSQRSNIIKDLTTARETTGSRMKELNVMWTTFYNNKYTHF